MKKFIQITAFILIVLCGGGAIAQGQQPVPLLGNIDSLIASIKKQPQQGHYPGMMVSIVTRDSILFSGGFGYADVEHHIKVTGSTLFSVASVTKVFTSLAIQKLIAEGKLRLYDELKKIAPEVHFENQWEATDPVRVVNLLEHTAGFDDVHVNRMVNPSGKIQTGLAAVKYVGNSLVCRWPPGKIYAYANPDYVVLGYLIEKLSGKPAYRYITENILRPLNMQQSHFDTTLARVNHAIGYKFLNGRFVNVRPTVLGGNCADGSLAASADDMSHFLKNQLNNWKTVKGGFLPAPALPDMETVHSTLAAKTGLKAGYALGNEMQPDDYKITFRRHYGHTEGFSTTLFYNREYGIGFVVSDNGEQLTGQVEKLIGDYLTKSIKQPSPVYTAKNLDALKPLMGYYQLVNFHSQQWGFYDKFMQGVTLSVNGGKLLVRAPGGNYDILYAAGNMLFAHQQDITPAFALSRDNDGNIFFQGYDLSFEKTAQLPVLIQKTLWYLGIIAMLLSIVLGIISIMMLIFRKFRPANLPLTLLPAAGVVIGIIAYFKFINTDSIEHSLYSTINGTTLFVFLGSLFFGLSIPAGLWFLYKRWYQLNNWLKIPLTFNMVFLCYFAGLLFMHGWIGVRVWAL